MKKKIVFVVINMNVGGTEKALLNMISQMPKENFEITILLLEKYGEFLSYIPDGVRVEYVEGYTSMKNIINKAPQIYIFELLKLGQFVKMINVLWYYLISKIMRERILFFQYLLKDYYRIEEYDVAVAYAGPVEFISYFVAHKIKAKKKIQWIHFDLSKIGFNKYFASKTYRYFDKIFVVSSEGKEKLNELLPNCGTDVEVFYNIMSPGLILEMANGTKGFSDNFNGIRILTVGRLSTEKGQDLTIPVLARLKAEGYNVRWYCVGDGNARSEYIQLIKDYKVEEDYILLGANPNPYPYMKECDIYIQPSRHEGFCITLAEARCFNKPIITTNFTGASEQILHEKNGLIVDFDEQKMYKAIKQLLDDKEFASKIRNNVIQGRIDTTREIEKLYVLLDKI